MNARLNSKIVLAAFAVSMQIPMRLARTGKRLFPRVRTAYSQAESYHAGFQFLKQHHTGVIDVDGIPRDVGAFLAALRKCDLELIVRVSERVGNSKLVADASEAHRGWSGCAKPGDQEPVTWL